MMKDIQKCIAEAAKNPAARAGMTLIEIMIVVTLMVAIMGMVGYNVIAQADKANAGIAQTQIKQYTESCDMYRIQNKKYPDKLDDLVKANIVKEIAEDPWGGEYIFEKTGNKIKIYSAGPDGIPNNEDDIVGD